MYYSACLPALFPGKPAHEALALLKDSGIPAYELWSWWDQDLHALLRTQEDTGMHISAMCTRCFTLNDPARHGEYIEGLQASVDAAQYLGCPTLISQVGADLGTSRAEQKQAIIECLKSCVPLLAKAGITLVIEPLNILIDHPGYYLTHAEEGFDIVRAVDSPFVRLLYDVYHQQVTEGNPPEVLTGNMHLIGHVHIAGVPGRHEPFDPGDYDCRAVLSRFAALGYTGPIGLEYMPTRDPVAELHRIALQCAL